MSIKPRKPWLAGLLSVLLPGLGHIYCGKARRGIKLYVLLQIIIPASFLIANLPIPYLNLALFLLILASTYLYIIIDAIGISRKFSVTYKLKPYNKWYLYLIAWILASCVVQPTSTYVIKNCLVQAYKIPSKAMQPTIFQGDRILANKFVYNFVEPKRGDIIIFSYPKDKSKDFMKRVAAVGGDIVEIRNKQLYINNEEVHENFAINTDPQIIPRGKHPRDNFGPVMVPPNSLFVLGDNRDHSFDSRFWGFVDRNTVKSKVSNIYWSSDRANNRIRWERIAKTVNQFVGGSDKG